MRAPVPAIRVLPVDELLSHIIQYLRITPADIYTIIHLARTSRIYRQHCIQEYFVEF